LVVAAPAENRITLSLFDRSLEDALDAVLTGAGLTWTTRGDVIFVTGIDSSSADPDLQGRRIRVFELDYASALDVDEAVKGLLSPVGKSWISQRSSDDNRRTREVVTVEDLPGYLARLEDYIRQIDQPPRQVLIQVHVLQVELKEDTATASTSAMWPSSAD
jgi:type IV pilus assembly protein PilQ